MVVAVFFKVWAEPSFKIIKRTLCLVTKAFVKLEITFSAPPPAKEFIIKKA